MSSIGTAGPAVGGERPACTGRRGGPIRLRPVPRRAPATGPARRAGGRSSVSKARALRTRGSGRDRARGGPVPAVAQGSRSTLAAPGGGKGLVCVGATSKLATKSAVALLRAGRPPKLSVELPMPALPQSLLDEVSAVLIEAGRRDLAERLVSFGHPEALTSGQAAKALGLYSVTSDPERATTTQVKSRTLVHHRRRSRSRRRRHLDGLWQQ